MENNEKRIYKVYFNVRVYVCGTWKLLPSEIKILASSYQEARSKFLEEAEVHLDVKDVAPVNL